MAIETAGFILTTIQVGGEATSSANGYIGFGKGKADKAYNDAVNQYEQLKTLRKDVGIDRYLSEEEREGLNKVIERLALELLLLKRTLQGLKGITYWYINSYWVEWANFQHEKAGVIERIIEVNVQILERSLSGRKLLESGRPAGTPGEASPSTRFLMSTSADDTRQEILSAAAAEVASVARSTWEGYGSHSQPEQGNSEQMATGRLSEDGTAHIITPSGQKKAMGASNGTRWYISPKSLSAPPSITVPETVELEDLRRDLD
ncbi:unnamed protein product [Rhizoctonia solani]|uniref:Uncharacterized protein n=1 Tax=Rhizoctonia solani TaxID=456999 RepID=A0A8H2XLM4_9AGAM